jgi:hypothetical protein
VVVEQLGLRRLAGEQGQVHRTVANQAVRAGSGCRYVLRRCHQLRGAKAAARNIQGSRLLSYAGYDQSAYMNDECSTRYVTNYLLSGALPAEGTVCPAPNPFIAPMSVDKAETLSLDGTHPMR